MQPLATGPRVKQRRRSELGLLLVAVVVITLAYLLAALGTRNALPPNALGFIGVIAGLALVVHLANRFLAPEADPVMMPVVLMLNGIGFVMIYRLDVSPQMAADAPWHYQAAWTALGVFAYVVTLFLVRRSRDLERYRYMLVFGALVLLVLPLAPYLGRTSEAQLNGVKLWIHVGPITFQPVEIAKLMLVIFFASYFVEKREMLSLSTRRVGNRLLPDLRPLGPIAVAWVVAILVILLEHDIGFSLLLFVTFITMLWVVTGRWTYVVGGLVAFVAGTYLAAHLPFAKTLIDERVSAWINPWVHYSSYGYQTVQGELALGRGGLTGSGLGLGTPYYIPVAYSDFIFAAIGEELGLLGTTAVVVGFMLVVGAGIRAAMRARSEFSQLAAVGFTAILGFQSFFIMAGVVRLLPLTGVSLPFIGYGGSSLVANYVLVALLMRISDEGATPPGVAIGLSHPATRMRRRFLVAARAAPAPDGAPAPAGEVRSSPVPAGGVRSSPVPAGGAHNSPVPAGEVRSSPVPAGGAGGITVAPTGASTTDGTGQIGRSSDRPSASTNEPTADEGGFSEGGIPC
ncbi:MAG: FtsW/RodA/SpoVE family cell cycle protein [Acidimicrobiales bacterium]